MSRWHRDHNKKAEEYVHMPKITPYEWQPHTTWNLMHLITKQEER